MENQGENKKLDLTKVLSKSKEMEIEFMANMVASTIVKKGKCLVLRSNGSCLLMVAKDNVSVKDAEELPIDLGEVLAKPYHSISEFVALEPVWSVALSISDVIVWEEMA